jgi:hypothetical protein
VTGRILSRPEYRSAQWSLLLPRRTLPRRTLPGRTLPRPTLPQPTPPRPPLRWPADGGGDPDQPGQIAPPRTDPVPARRRVAWPLAAGAWLLWAVAGLALFALFLRMSRTAAVNSDGASNALQAWAMLHGDPLLRGWQLSDVSFYTTELPQYLVIEAVRGLTPDVVHVAAAMTYTFTVLLAARLAKGDAGGRQGLLRALLAVGIMIAPQRSEVTVLMLSPDHVGSTVPVMLTWLLIDRAGRRWYVPPACGVLLAWAVVADQVVLLTGIAPIVAVGLLRAYRQLIARRGPFRSAAFDLGLAAAGLAAVGAARAALSLIRAAGGFTVYPVDNRVVGARSLGDNLLQTFHGILLLFGANFLGQMPGVAVAIAVVHLAGAGLAVWAVCAGLRRFAAAGIVVQLMVTATVVSVVAYAFGPNASEALSSREFAAVLPFGAALAGRMLAGRLSRAHLVPALTAALAVYAIGAARVAAAPAAAAENQAVAGWLAAHRLSYGLSEYWMANSITLDSGGAVQVRSLLGGRAGVFADWWETKPGWYSPAAHDANFVVLPSNGIGPPPGPGPAAPTMTEVVATFGQPARAYFLADYTILVWSTNILANLR